MQWLDRFNSFEILDKKKLTTILRHYFRHSKYNSFIRQLNLYGYKKVRVPGRKCCYMNFKKSVESAIDAVEEIGKKEDEGIIDMSGWKPRELD